MRLPWWRAQPVRPWLGDGPGPREPVPDDAGSVTSAWKELLVYAEGEGSFTFDATWGGAWRVYVPDVATWDDVVPAWLVGRREEVVGRVARHNGHVVVETDTGYSRQG